jgi:hypothetical protein
MNASMMDDCVHVAYVLYFRDSLRLLIKSCGTLIQDGELNSNIISSIIINLGRVIC